MSRGRVAERVGESERYENKHRLCNVCSPDGISIEPAERIG